MLDELGYRVLSGISCGLKRRQVQKRLTLDISLKMDCCALSKSEATSLRLCSIAASSPTARVMRVASCVRRLWSMFNSLGEPGAKNALYKPVDG